MTQTQIPEQMTAVVLDSYSGAEALRVEQRPVPKPGKDEVLENRSDVSAGFRG